MSTLLAALVATAVLAAGCSSRTDAASAAPASDPAGQVQATLIEAAEAGKAWGRQHLGHYIDMTEESLAEQGFRAPAGVTVQVQAEHMEFCVIVTHPDLPDDHEWRTGAMTSRAPRPFPEDDCGL